MPAPTRFVCQVVSIAVLGLGLGFVLAACAGKPAGEMPTAAAAKPAAPTPAAEQAAEPPMERAEANAQCWMKYDKSGVSLEAKAKLVETCAAEKMKGR